MSRADCPFCQPLPKERIVAEADISIAFFDGFPVSNGPTFECHGQTWVRMDELQVLTPDWNQRMKDLLCN